MEMVTRKRLGLYAGRSCRPLAEEIASLLNEKLGEVQVVEFASGETYCRFEESVRDTDVFIIQTHADPINDTIMEQMDPELAAKERAEDADPDYGTVKPKGEG